MHACRHADSGRLGHLYTPIARSSKTDMSTLFHTLFETSWRSDHTNYAILFTQHSLGQSWSHFLQFHTAALFLFQTTCVFHTVMPPEHRSETKFVVRVLPERLDAVSTRSCRSGQSSVDLAGCFGSSSVPASFLYSLTQTNGPLDPQVGQKRKSHTNISHTHTQSPTGKQTWREQ